ncbi:MAG: hypothetical protein JXQ81_06310 [Desulfuromonadales bacterium]|nr:hypothetical protein [Desulfuromonadales bacterium]
MEQAAWGGHAQGQLLLAALFKKGLGGRENPAEALVWLKRSAQNGNREAERALQRLARTLTATEQEQAGRLLKKVAKADRNGLYQIPKVRYIQAQLNAMGFTAGDED